MYTAITLNGNTDIYFANQLLWKSITIKGILKDKFYVQDINNTRLLELEIKHFFGFGEKYLIVEQRLQRQIDLLKIRKKLYLKVANDTISLNKKMKAWKFDGNFIVDNKISGSFKNHLTLLKSSFTFDFKNESETNFYCILLFSILVIDEFNTQPPS